MTPARVSLAVAAACAALAGLVIVAFLVGFLCMVFIAYLMHWALSLQSEGAVFRIEDAIGKRGSVYERISASGMGRIQISLGGMVRELQAVSEGKETLESLKPVVVVRVIDSQTVSVQPVN